MVHLMIERVAKVGASSEELTLVVANAMLMPGLDGPTSDELVAATQAARA